MKNRVGLIAGVITLALLVTGIAWAAQDNSRPLNISLAEGQETQIAVDGAGVVLLRRTGAGSLEIRSATPNAGFVAEVEIAAGAEVEADFRGNGQRHQFNAELEDGIVRVRIRADADAQTGTTTGSTASTSTIQGAASSSTSTTTPAAVALMGDLQLAAGQSVEVAIADAGFVVLSRSDASLQILSTDAKAGWVVEVEVAQGREVEGDFRSGDRRVKFNFELEDGLIRVRIESEVSNSGSTSTTATAAANGSTTSTTTATAGLPIGSVTYDLNGAGTVTVLFVNGTMSIGVVSPAAGWSVAESEDKGNEIEVELTNGDEEAELKLRIEDGQLRVEVERKS